MTENKPKEFWIDPEEVSEFEDSEDFIHRCGNCFSYKPITKDFETIHVIEYSALEQLKKENEELKYKKEYLISGYETIQNELMKENEQLKQLMSVQLDIVEQNKQMSDEITALKAAIKVLEDEIEYYQGLSDLDVEPQNEQLKSKLKIAVDALKEIKNISAYAGNPTKEIFGYLIKQSGIKSPMIAHQALSEIGEV